ncbi:flagellar hook-associated protein FlgL [Nocardioides sp.]|uniref:flagellar hook-associated protein FlgL n=1 Tax=Nocardioides sp. TaxID=35761 RepID=UPI002736313F|nr:flagellar hook-associated protein FlgL [Nocardioides sp.]MDP3894535.1 flagellar hook-associated protein FlgL [Nocardioides sp.]
MAITRVTQNMMTQQSVGSLQTALGRLARTQEQLSTGRVLNRPSDSPTDTTMAMRIRTSLTEQRQFTRNAEDGVGWLGTIEATLSSMTDQLRRARELTLQGANSGAMSATAREALAVEMDQIRESLVGAANTTRLGRPVFGGVTAGDAAYDAAGTYVGVPGEIRRTVSDGVRVAVNVDGPAVFGPTGDSVFDHLTAAAAALRAGDAAAVSTGLANLGGDLDRITSTLADVGTRYARLEKATQAAADRVLALTTSLSTIENTDLPRAMVDLQLQEVAYQASLAATARVMQPSLVDFLR